MIPYSESYTVAYRSGGTHRCYWRRVLVRFTQQGAADMQETIERSGFKALVYKTASLDAIGLPIGWESGLVDYERDEIRISALETFVSRRFAHV